MSSYQRMIMIPESLYNTYLTHKDKHLRDGATAIHIRQLNNFDVNPGGGVTIRNDNEREQNPTVANPNVEDLAPSSSSPPPLTLPTANINQTKLDHDKSEQHSFFANLSRTLSLGIIDRLKRDKEKLGKNSAFRQNTNIEEEESENDMFKPPPPYPTLEAFVDMSEETQSKTMNDYEQIVYNRLEKLNKDLSNESNEKELNLDLDEADFESKENDEEELININENERPSPPSMIIPKITKVQTKKTNLNDSLSLGANPSHKENDSIDLFREVEENPNSPKSKLIKPVLIKIAETRKQFDTETISDSNKRPTLEVRGESAARIAKMIKRTTAKNRTKRKRSADNNSDDHEPENDAKSRDAYVPTRNEQKQIKNCWVTLKKLKMPLPPQSEDEGVNQDLVTSSDSDVSEHESENTKFNGRAAKKKARGKIIEQFVAHKSLIDDDGGVKLSKKEKSKMRDKTWKPYEETRKKKKL